MRLFIHSSCRYGAQVPTCCLVWFLYAVVSFMFPACTQLQQTDAGGLCLALTVCETFHTNPRVFFACSRPGQLTSVTSNCMQKSEAS